jgi:biotin carboxyl carrier protein
MIEAMKMEVEIKAPVGGIVSSVSVKVGDQVRSGQELASIN